MRIYVYTDDGRTVEMTEDFRVTYDAAVGSMDFGSGFLDTEEVAALRRVARVLGVDPAPYQHDKCATCGHDRERHRRQQCWTDEDGNWLRSGAFYPEVTPQSCPCVEFAEEEA